MVSKVGYVDYANAYKFHLVIFFFQIMLQPKQERVISFDPSVHLYANIEKGVWGTKILVIS